ncbi:MAG: ABC transporter ATP-binding protein [Actinobacteria bacterium]|nr:ABC transporter ATP-binding protein [Actinomycetota bacterium]
MSSPATDNGQPRTAISCRGLGKRFGDVAAVAGLDLEAEAGAITALLGPSGCGKTTTLRLIAGFERPDAGSIELGGRTISDAGGAFVPPERRRIGLVFQDYALFPHLDVAANVAYALPRGEAESRVGGLLDLVGLGDLGTRRVNELSGGQQQRVALARALAADPEAILLDEPFSNLDASLRDRMRRELRAILVEAGATAIFVTHDQEEALSLADRVAVMRGGGLEQVGTPEEVYERPVSRWVAEFLGEAEVLPARAHRGSVECALGSLSADPGLEGQVEVIVRPESLGLGSGPAPGNASSSRAVVVERDFYGHDQLLHLELDSGLRLRCRRPGFPAWHPGDHVRVWLEGPVTVLPAVRPSAVPQ